MPEGERSSPSASRGATPLRGVVRGGTCPPFALRGEAGVRGALRGDLCGDVVDEEAMEELALVLVDLSADAEAARRRAIHGGTPRAMTLELTRTSTRASSSSSLTVRATLRLMPVGSISFQLRSQRRRRLWSKTTFTSDSVLTVSPPRAIPRSSSSTSGPILPATQLTREGPRFSSSGRGADLNVRAQRTDGAGMTAAVHDAAHHRPVFGTERHLAGAAAAVAVRAQDRRLVLCSPARSREACRSAMRTRWGGVVEKWHGARRMARPDPTAGPVTARQQARVAMP